MLRIGAHVFDPASRRLLFGGKEESKLSPKAAAVLSALSEDGGYVWSRSAMLERVWPNADVGEEVLTQTIAELRRAFGDDYRAPRVIATVHRSGYRLLPKVSTDTPSTCVDQQQALSFQCYIDFLEAHALRESGGKENLESAVAKLSKLAAAHPRFTLAHAELAKAFTYMAAYYCGYDRAQLRRAVDLCETAKRVDGGGAETLAAQGFASAVAGNTTKGLEAFHAALGVRPDCANTHYLLGRTHLTRGEFAAAAIMFERAAKLQPSDSTSLLLAAKLRIKLGRPDLARAHFKGALASLDLQLLADPDSVQALSGKAKCLHHLGKPNEARALVLSVPRTGDPFEINLALALARLELTDDALDVLGAVIEAGWRHRDWIEHDPDFDGLRDNSRFRRMVASLV